MSPRNINLKPVRHVRVIRITFLTVSHNPDLESIVGHHSKSAAPSSQPIFVSLDTRRNPSIQIGRQISPLWRSILPTPTSPSFGCPKLPPVPIIVVLLKSRLFGKFKLLGAKKGQVSEVNVLRQVQRRRSLLSLASSCSELHLRPVSLESLLRLVRDCRSR
jgi:hypothetical protein